MPSWPRYSCATGVSKATVGSPDRHVVQQFARTLGETQFGSNGSITQRQVRRCLLIGDPAGESNEVTDA